MCIHIYIYIWIEIDSLGFHKVFARVYISMGIRKFS